MTIQNAINKVAKNAGLTGHDGLFECKLALESALVWLAGRIMFPQLASSLSTSVSSLNSSAPTIAVPADMLTLAGNSFRLTISESETFLRMGRENKTHEHPASFRRVGPNFILNPFTSSEGVVTFDYYKRPTLQDLQNTADFPYPVMESWAILYASANMVAATDTNKFQSLMALAAKEEQSIITTHAGDQVNE